MTEGRVRQHFSEIGRHVLALLSGNATAVVLNFATTAYLARVLAHSALGYLTYAQSVTFYAILVIDLGLSTHGNREVAGKRASSPRLVAGIVQVRLLLGILLYATSFVVLRYSPIPVQDELRQVLIISLLAVFPFAWNCDWFFLGSRRMTAVAWSKAIDQGLTLGLTVFLVRSSSDLEWAALARVCGNSVATIFLIRLIGPVRAGFRRVRLAHGLSFASRSTKLWVLALVSQVYNGVDIAILHWTRPSEEVGIYSASFRLAGFLTLMISLFNMVLFPMLSTAFQRSASDFRRLILIYWIAVCGICSFLLLIMAAGSGLLVSLSLGDRYGSAVPVVRILMIATIILSVNGAIAQPLLASGRDHKVMNQVILTAVVYLALNALLIRKFGMYAAAWVYVVSVLAGTVGMLPSYLRLLRTIKDKSELQVSHSI